MFLFGYEGIVVAILALLALVVVGLLISYGSLYIQSLISGVHVGLFSLVAMRLRKVNPGVIVNTMIMTHKAGVRISREFLESHYLARGNVPLLAQALVMGEQAGLKIRPEALGAHLLAGGDVKHVVRALIAAGKAHIELTFDQACSIDLAGRDIVDAVNTSVDPRVIDCPNPNTGRTTLDAVAQDGIQLKARARVTVRTCLERLVGGATDETIVARVGEGIVSAIGSSHS